MKPLFTLVLVTLLVAGGAISCRKSDSGTVTIALSEKFSTLDTISSVSTDAAADRIRTLIYNSLVKKNESFEYVGELASDIKTGGDGLSMTFTLRKGVKFHDGSTFTSKDVKYTLDSLFAANGAKAGSFFDSAADPADPEKKRRIRTAHIIAIETPDDETVVIRVGRPALVNQTLSNLVTIPIIPVGSLENQKTAPVGSGPFKFVSFDQVSGTVAMESFADYWEGPSKIAKLTVKSIPDANALQAELQSGSVDLAPLPTNLTADAVKTLGQLPALSVFQFPGSNVQYIGFNTSIPPFDNPKMRQAVAYAIDRDKIINELFSGQARKASSVLPPESWAFAQGASYPYDADKARALIAESGYKGEVISFKFSATAAAIKDYAQVIQDSLVKVGLNVQIETVEPNTLRTQLNQGQFQMSTAAWVGGNQDPIFLRDLFASTDFPDRKDTGRNRSRYSNPAFDKLILEAVGSVDREKQKVFYAQAQKIVSEDLPLFPLWYPANIVISTKRIANVKINASGDWNFVKDLVIK